MYILKQLLFLSFYLLLHGKYSAICVNFKILIIVKYQRSGLVTLMSGFFCSVLLLIISSI